MGVRRKIVLIDGYNVINRVPELRPSMDAGLENARLRLALQVSTWNRTHPSFEPIIVFDGDERHSGGPDQRIAGVRCLFSRASHGGDDEIIRLTRDQIGKGAEVTVVSDDNKVGNNCGALGAMVRPSSFIMSIKAPGPPSALAGKRPGGGKSISRKAAAEIDEELRKKYGI